MTTVEAFLEPPHYGRNELGHVLANMSDGKEESHDSANSRFTGLPDVIERWEDFDIQQLSSTVPLAKCLSRECNVQWEPHIPSVARVIYSERQLEALYLQTLITRVNIALDKAIPPGEARVTIVLGPGLFECVSPESDVYKIEPDWVVLHGTYDSSMASFPVLQDLAKHGGILAAGDTKMVRHVDSSLALLRTKTCYPDFLRQLQDYCVNLYTRFGFILSNKELIVTQFKREEYHSFREDGPRNLRSKQTKQTKPTEPTVRALEPDLFADHYADVDDRFSGGDSVNFSFYDHNTTFPKVLEIEDDPYDLPALPIGRQSIERQSIESQSVRSQSVESQSPESQPVESQFTNRPPKRSRPSTSPSSSFTERNGHPIEGRRLSGSSHFVRTDAQRAHVSDTSQVPDSSTVLQSSSQDHSKYAPSARDYEVGEIKIRNFGMTESDEKGEHVSPYKALFLFIMMIRNIKLNGESIAV